MACLRQAGGENQATHSQGGKRGWEGRAKVNQYQPIPVAIPLPSFQVLVSLRLPGFQLVRNRTENQIHSQGGKEDGRKGERKGKTNPTPDRHSAPRRASLARTTACRESDGKSNSFTGRMVRMGGKPKAGEQGNMEEKAKPRFRSRFPSRHSAPRRASLARTTACRESDGAPPNRHSRLSRI